MKTDNNLQKSIEFLESIGISIIERELDNTTFLPGLLLGCNTIYVDYSKLKYPGDILHEAGHIAVSDPNERNLVGTKHIPDTWPTQAEEIAAILWSFAALQHLDLPIDFVFHPEGYKNHSEWFIENFKKGNYIGLPLLQWFKMAHSNDEIANGKPCFPAMQDWIRKK